MISKRAVILIPLFAGLFSFAFGVSAQAGSAERQAKLQELYELSGMAAQGDEVGDLLYKTVMSDALKSAGYNAPDDLSAQLDLVFADIVNQQGKSLKITAIKLYDNSYTDKELDYILDFYRTPLGQSVNAKALVIQKSLANEMRKWVVTTLPILAAKMDQVTEKYTREHGDGWRKGTQK